MIHTTQIASFADTKPDNISLSFIEKSGDRVDIDDCSCTSTNHENKTINVRITSSGQVRTIRTITIIEYNGQEVVR